MQISVVQFCCDAPKTSQIRFARMGFVQIKVILYMCTRFYARSARCMRITDY